MVRLQRSFVPLALALFLAACTTPEPAPADTTSDAGDTSPDTSPGPDGDSAGPGEVLAAATLGPAGGAIFEFEFELIVRPGSLAADTPIEIRRAPPRPGLTFLGTPLELHPPGLVFDPPAVMRLVIPDDRRGAQVAVLLTLAQDTSAFQDVTHAVGGNIAMAHVPHFSTIGLVAGSPGSASTAVCCTPKSPTVGPTDCILNPANNTSCDPDICDQAPGPCAAVAPSNTPPCPCKPINAATPVADCLTCDPQKCVPDHQYCPPGDLCDVCVAPEYADKPEFKDLFDNYILNFGDSTCAELAVLNTSPPSLSSESWCFFGGAAKWCAFQSLLDEKGCTASATTLAPMCGGDGCCKPIVPGFDVPGPIGCSGLPELECEVYAGQGSIIPQYCVWDGGAVCAPPTAPGVTCGDCAALASDAGFAASYGAALATYDDETCYDLQNALALTAPADTSNPSLVGTWCGHQAATYTACGQLAQFGCEPLALPPTPPSDCEACTDPDIRNQPDWQAAYNGGVMTYINGGMDCPTLAQQNVPAPSGAPGSTQYLTTLGRWCAMNEALHGAGCTAGSSGGVTTIAPFCERIGCCKPIVPGVDVPGPIGCSALPEVECEVYAGQGVNIPQYCAWDASATCPAPSPPVCCKPIDPQNNNPNFGVQTCEEIDHSRNCWHSAGKDVCYWDLGPQCPAVGTCDDCARYHQEVPGFTQAVVDTLNQLYASVDCADLNSISWGHQVFTDPMDDTLLKYCAWGARFAQCSSPQHTKCALP